MPDLLPGGNWFPAHAESFERVPSVIIMIYLRGRGSGRCARRQSVRQGARGAFRWQAFPPQQQAI